MALGLMAHMLPGFNNLLFFDAVKLSEKSLPFTMYLNLDKPFVGVLLLVFAGTNRSTTSEEIFTAIQRSLPILLVLLSLVLLPSFYLNYIAFDPKLPPYGWVWIINNLLLVCVTEEVFFRGFLQGNLADSLKESRFGWIMAIVVVAVFFRRSPLQGWPRTNRTRNVFRIVLRICFSCHEKDRSGDTRALRFKPDAFSVVYLSGVGCVSGSNLRDRNTRPLLDRFSQKFFRKICIQRNI